MYLGPGWSFGTKDHLVAVGKSAPPRPRRPEALTSSITSAAVIPETTLRRPPYPPNFSYTASLGRLALPNHSVKIAPPTVPRCSATLLRPRRGFLSGRGRRSRGRSAADYLLRMRPHQAAV